MRYKLISSGGQVIHESDDRESSYCEYVARTNRGEVVSAIDTEERDPMADMLAQVKGIGQDIPTRRERIATHVLAALAGVAAASGDDMPDLDAARAIEFADALIAELDKP